MKRPRIVRTRLVYSTDLIRGAKLAYINAKDSKNKN